MDESIWRAQRSTERRHDTRALTLPLVVARKRYTSPSDAALAHFLEYP